MSKIKQSASPQSPQKNSTKKAVRLCCIALALVLFGAAGASMVQSDFGKIEVTNLTIPYYNGQYVSADLFRPKTATADNPAPLVIVLAGSNRTKETQLPTALELARRGYVVISMDPNSTGDTATNLSTDRSNGMYAALEYVTNTNIFNYVDSTKIGITGHSAGGNAALRAATYYSQLETEALEAAAAEDSDGGAVVTEREAAYAASLNKINACFNSGYLRSYTDETFAPLHCNFALGYAFYDEGGYRNINKNGDLRYAPEAIAMVNSTLSDDEKVTEVEIGKMYGSAADRTLRVAYNEKTLHPIQSYSKVAIEAILEFFEISFGVPSAISTGNQTWLLKEFLNGIALIGAFLFLVPFAEILMTLPCFASVKQPIPPRQPKQSKKGKIIFWSSFAFCALVACFIYAPMTTVSDATLNKFVRADGLHYLFPADRTNVVVLWAVFNGLLGLLLFFLTYKFHGKAEGTTPESWGLKISLKDFFKTFALALIVAGAFFALVHFSYGMFNVDLRFMLLSARPLTRRTALVTLNYLPLFFIFYFSNSLRVNGSMRPANWSERKSMVVAVLGNTVGLLLIEVIQYATFAITGTVFWTSEWLYINLLLTIIPMMALLPIYNRAFFNKTGRVWLGPLVTCMVFIGMTIANVAVSTPLR